MVSQFVFQVDWGCVVSMSVVPSEGSQPHVYTARPFSDTHLGTCSSKSALGAVELLYVLLKFFLHSLFYIVFTFRIYYHLCCICLAARV